MKIRDSIVSGLAALILASSSLNAEVYQVMRGDTYTSISKKLGVSVNSLRNSNPETNPNKIIPRQKLNYTLQTINHSNSSNQNISSENNERHISQEGIEYLKKLEGGFVNHPYPDADKMAIGYGHDILPGESYSIISKEEGENLLRNDIKSVEKVVNSYVKVPLNDNQYAALICFTYNVGTNAFKHSRLLQALNSGNYENAAGKFKNWTKSNGQNNFPSLVRRRMKERDLFLRR